MIPTTPDHVAVQVGPQDPDSTAELTQRYGVGENALELLKGQADNMPAELMGILAMPADKDGRSEALVYDEVVRRAGDLLTRDGSILHSAYVRGASEATRVVTITYTVPSGRVGKASLGPWAKFSKSVEEFERVRRAKMGMAAADFALSPKEGEQPPDASPELAEQRKLIEDMQAELATLRNPEPVPGYRDLNARDAAQAVYDMDSSQLDVVERYEAYAAGDGDARVTVLRAVEKRREDLAKEQVDLEALRSARAAGTDPLAPAPEPSGEGDSGTSET